MTTLQPQVVAWSDLDEERITECYISRALRGILRGLGSATAAGSAMTIDLSDEVLSKANEWFSAFGSAAPEHIESLWLDFESWIEASPVHDAAFNAVEDARSIMVDLGWFERSPTDF